MNRPSLGTTIFTNFVAEKVRTSHANSNHMRIRPNFNVTWKKKPKTIQGIYIGYRFVFEGYTASDAEGYSARWFVPKRSKEVWLIVSDPRKEPVRAFPEDCIWGVA